LLDDLTTFEKNALTELASADSRQALEHLRHRTLGRKGRLAELMSLLRSVPTDERPAVGKKANEVRVKLERAFGEKQAEIEKSRALAEATDHTLPGRAFPTGCLHPITSTLGDVVEILRGMGFAVATGPDIEDEFHNFDALNTPKDHPARAESDTFYLGDGYLLRTHTSPVQIRVLEKTSPPVRVIAPGRCFRRDAPDATHLADFFQCEGLYVDRDVTMAELKGTLTAMAESLFEGRVEIRFRPHFFPFTEPSVEYDFRVPGRDEWLEISGAGMVDPEVFKAVGLDPEEWSGFAFGMGIERIAMIRHGITDMRRFHENDVRFLRSVGGGL
jgi:phenylalanyl-tRNA synthetase alpha chain